MLVGNRTLSGGEMCGPRPITKSPLDWPLTATPAKIADKTIANALKHGLSEHYDSVNGQPLGVPEYCMSSTIATMMLDGLSREYQLKSRE